MNAFRNDKILAMQESVSKAERLLKLLANAKRLLILCHLLKGERSVGELETLVGLSQSALSQHLARMRREGVLAIRKRGTHVYYCISKPEVEAVLSTLYLIYCKH